MSIYDWATIFFLLATPVVGIVVFGASRIWSVAPLMFLFSIGFILFALRPVLSEQHRMLHVPPAGLLLLFFLVYTLSLIPFAAVPYEARIDVLRLASFVGAYWAWTELATRYKRWRILIAFMLLLGTLISWYAIIQHAHGTRMVLNLERPIVYEMRASGTYICPNHFANLLEILAVFAFVLITMRDAGGPLRLFALYSLLLFLPTIFLTQSRSGWIGMAVGLTVAAALIALRKSVRRFLLIILLAPTLTAAVGVTAWSTSPMVRERVRGAMLSTADGAVAARILMWKDSIQMIKHKPFFGHGPGSFRWVYPEFKGHDMPFTIRYAHNEFLHAAVDYGLVGLVFLVCIAGYFFFRLLRMIRSARRDKDACLLAALAGSLSACMAHACFDFNFHVFANMHVLAMFAGLVVAGCFASGEIGARPLSGKQSTAMAATGLTLGLSLAFLSAQAFLSFGFNFLGDRSSATYDMELARSRYNQSIRVDSSNWQPYLSMAQSYQAESFWNRDAASKKEQADKALSFFQQTIDRNARATDAYFGMSQVHANLGDSEQALELLEYVVEHARNFGFYLAHLGRLQRQMGLLDEALSTFRQARELGDSREMIDANIVALEQELAEKNRNKAP